MMKGSVLTVIFKGKEKKMSGFLPCRLENGWIEIEMKPNVPVRVEIMLEQFQKKPASGTEIRLRGKKLRQIAPNTNLAILPFGFKLIIQLDS